MLTDTLSHFLEEHVLIKRAFLLFFLGRIIQKIIQILRSVIT